MTSREGRTAAHSGHLSAIAGDQWLAKPVLIAIQTGTGGCGGSLGGAAGATTEARASTLPRLYLDENGFASTFPPKMRRAGACVY